MSGVVCLTGWFRDGAASARLRVKRGADPRRDRRGFRRKSVTHAAGLKCYLCSRPDPLDAGRPFEIPSGCGGRFETGSAVKVSDE
jgi:hypothetical protein